MNRFFYFFCCFLFVLSLIPHIHADNRIIMYLSNAPHSVIAQAEHEAQQGSLRERLEQLEAKSPGELSKSIAKHSLKSIMRPKLSGFVALYGGYMDISDTQGLISFPLRHASQKLYLAITPRIAMINVRENTFAHREYVTDDNNPLALYTCELKQDAKGTSFWNIAQTTMPDDKKINPLTIVILTNPKNIYVPTGDIITTQNQQLIVPDLFVIGRSNTDEAVLQSIDLRRFFEPITTDFKKTSDVIQQKAISNI